MWKGLKSKGASLIEAVVAFSMVAMIIFILTSLLSSMIISQEHQVCHLNAYSKEWMDIRAKVDSIQRYAQKDVELSMKHLQENRQLEEHDQINARSIVKNIQTFKGSATHACFEEVENIKLIHLEKETARIHTN